MRRGVVLVARDHQADACVAASMTESIVKTHAAGLEAEWEKTRSTKWLRKGLIGLPSICYSSIRVQYQVYV